MVGGRLPERLEDSRFARFLRRRRRRTGRGRDGGPRPRAGGRGRRVRGGPLPLRGRRPAEDARPSGRNAIALRNTTKRARRLPRALPAPRERRLLLARRGRDRVFGRRASGRGACREARAARPVGHLSNGRGPEGEGRRAQGVPEPRGPRATRAGTEVALGLSTSPPPAVSPRPRPARTVGPHHPASPSSRSSIFVRSVAPRNYREAPPRRRCDSPREDRTTHLEGPAAGYDTHYKNAKYVVMEMLARRRHPAAARARQAAADPCPAHLTVAAFTRAKSRADMRHAHAERISRRRPSRAVQRRKTLVVVSSSVVSPLGTWSSETRPPAPRRRRTRSATAARTRTRTSPTSAARSGPAARRPAFRFSLSDPGLAEENPTRRSAPLTATKTLNFFPERPRS